MTVVLTVSAVIFLVGVLIGCTLTERAFERRLRRQAAMQHALNRQWQELEAAQNEHYNKLAITAVNTGDLAGVASKDEFHRRLKAGLLRGPTSS